MAAGDDGSFLYAEDGLAALALPLFLRIKVRPRRSSLNPSPVKPLDHVSSGRAINTHTLDSTTPLPVPFDFVQYSILTLFFVFGKLYIIVIHLSQIFIADLGQCNCLSRGQTGRGE